MSNIHDERQRFDRDAVVSDFSESRRTVICQGDTCGSSAVRHALYGYPHRGDKAMPISRVWPYPITHADLCHLHIDEIKGQYLDVALIGVGECWICELA